VYAPHSGLTQNDDRDDLRKNFYKSLQDTLDRLKNDETMIIMAGDWNSKLGRGAEESIIGKYGKGTRNPNGQAMSEFLSRNKLFASNTMFPHPMRHRTTFGVDRTTAIYNQIDIAIQQRYKLLVTGARSCRGQEYESDHRIAVTRMTMKWFYKAHASGNSVRNLPDMQRLATCPALRTRYASRLEAVLKEAVKHNDEVNMKYDKVVKSIQKAAEVLPKKATTRKGLFTVVDDQIDSWRRERTATRNMITDNPHFGPHAPKEEEQDYEEISQRTAILREAQVNNVAEDLERYKGTQRSFEAFRLLRKTEYKPFKMVDADGNICNNPSTVIPIINTFYQAFYNQTGMEPTEPFMTDPKALSHPITAAEVEASAKMLRNGRASGSDGFVENSSSMEERSCSRQSRISTTKCLKRTSLWKVC
jgi:hypothetical protein